MDLNRIRIIAFTGNVGVGKTTSAKYLETRGYIRVRFADTLKRMLIAFGLTREQVDGDLKEVPCEELLGKTPRHAMQTLGTEWGKAYIGEPVWANKLCTQIEEKLKNMSRPWFVIDDLRFSNELNALNKKFGQDNILVVRVHRNEEDVRKNQHLSELAIDGIEIDEHIYNIGTIEELQDIVADIVQETYNDTN